MIRRVVLLEAVLMTRPYSMDLRQRVVAAVTVGGMSRRRAAGHFGVAISTAIKWLDRVRSTGSAAPAQMGGYEPRAIAGAHREWLLQRCREADFTLRGLVACQTASKSFQGTASKSFQLVRLISAVFHAV